MADLFNEVCPSCYDGMHSACRGNGCYCDCQLEDHPGQLSATEAERSEYAATRRAVKRNG